MSAPAALLGLASDGLNASRDLFEGVVPVGGEGESTPKSVFSHWSQLCVLGAGILALVSGIALAIIGQYVTAAICGALLIVNVIAFYYLKKFIPLKSLEGITDALNRRAQELFQSQQELGRVKNELNTVSSQLIQEKALSEKALQNQQADFAQKSKLMSEAVTSLKLLKGEKTELLAKNASLASQLEATTRGISENLERFIELNKQNELLETHLLSDGNDLKVVLEEIKDESGRLELIRKMVAEERAKATLFMQEQIEIIKKINEENQQYFVKETAIFEGFDQKVAAELHDIRNIQIDFEKTNTQFQDSLKQELVSVEKTDQLLATLKKLLGES